MIKLVLADMDGTSTRSERIVCGVKPGAGLAMEAVRTPAAR